LIEFDRDLIFDETDIREDLYHCKGRNQIRWYKFLFKKRCLLANNESNEIIEHAIRRTE
jgi:hypothetical protein